MASLFAFGSVFLKFRTSLLENEAELKIFNIRLTVNKLIDTYCRNWACVSDMLKFDLIRRPRRYFLDDKSMTVSASRYKH